MDWWGEVDFTWGGLGWGGVKLVYAAKQCVQRAVANQHAETLSHSTLELSATTNPLLLYLLLNLLLYSLTYSFTTAIFTVPRITQHTEPAYIM